MSDYTVKTEIFEGPLELLLSLIEKRKLFINDISLASVTDEFIEYIRKEGEFPVSQAAHFIFVASTLLLIKSKSLLPALELTEEESGDIADLEHRLKLYQIFNELARHIKQNYGSRVLFSRRVPPREPVFSPDKHVTIPEVHAAIERVCHNLPAPDNQVPSAVVQEIVSLEETIDTLAKRVTRQLELSFRDFSQGGGAGERADVIVGFLAMLELVKQGAISVRQDDHFGDITMRSEHVEIPRYE